MRKYIYKGCLLHLIMINKNDFIEFRFTGKVKDGEIFDTNIKEDSEKAGLNIDNNPFVICVGKGMVINGLDKELEGKELKKQYQIELPPEKAFKKRKRDLVKLIPLRVFREKNVNPQPGQTLALDDLLVRIISVSGGRILADFNNPLAGKTVIYNFQIEKKVEAIEKKVEALMNYFLKEKPDFEIKQNKIIIKNPNLKNFVQMINEKFKDALGKEMIVGENKKPENSQKQ